MALDEDETPVDFMDRVRDFAKSWFPAIFAVLCIRTYGVEPFRIPSGSMVPTLEIGDHVAVTKFSYGIWVPLTLVDIPGLEYVYAAPRIELLRLGEPERGDIIVFRYPRQETVHYIKRVVGLPGDVISVKNNTITVNGEVQERTYKGKYDFVDSSCRTLETRQYVEDLGGLEHMVLTNKGLGGPLADTNADIVVPEDSVFVMGDNRDFSEDSRRWGMVRYDQIKGKAHLVWLSWDGCQEPMGSVRGGRFFENLYTLPAE